MHRKMTMVVVAVLLLHLSSQRAVAEENFCSSVTSWYMNPKMDEYKTLASKVRQLTNYNVLCELPERKGTGDKLVHAIAARGDSDLLYRIGFEGADLNARNLNGDTPLIRAAITGTENSLVNIGVLVLSGVDVNARNNDGLSALDIVSTARKRLEKAGITSGRDYRHISEVEEILVSNGARSKQ